MAPLPGDGPLQGIQDLSSPEQQKSAKLNVFMAFREALHEIRDTNLYPQMKIYNDVSAPLRFQEMLSSFKTLSDRNHREIMRFRDGDDGARKAYIDEWCSVLKLCYEGMDLLNKLLSSQGLPITEPIDGRNEDTRDKLLCFHEVLFTAKKLSKKAATNGPIMEDQDIFNTEQLLNIFAGIAAGLSLLDITGSDPY